MSVQEPSTPIALGEVLFSSDGIALVEGETITRRLPRSKVTAIEIRRGFISALPLPQLGLGFLLAWVGILSARAFVIEAINRTGPLKAIGLLTMLIPVGGWIAFDALKRGEYVNIKTTGGPLRIPLCGASPAEVQSLCERARSELGYEIEDRRSDPIGLS